MIEREPAWITYEQIIAIHSHQLRRFGGAPGLLDKALLLSALQRPVFQWQHGKADMARPAAAYAFGLAKNRAFVDGNERIAFMTMMVFLRTNDISFSPAPAHAASIVMLLAAGEVSEDSLTRWIGDNWPEHK